MKTQQELEEQKIRQVYDVMGDLFSHPTRELFAQLFTTDSDYVIFNGHHLKGIEENYRIHKQLSGIRFFRDARLISEIISLKFLSDTTAVVIARGGVLFRWQKRLPPNRLSISTASLVKEDDTWKITSFQNTRIRPLGFFGRMFTKHN